MIALFCADIKYLGMVCITELHFVCALITHCLYTIAHNNKHDYANNWYDTHLIVVHFSFGGSPSSHSCNELGTAMEVGGI